MTSLRFLPLLTVGVFAANAQDPAPQEAEPPLTFQILPLAIEADPKSKDLLEDFFIENPIVDSPEESIEYKIRIITPNPKVDYKILRIEPKPGIDYKLRIIDPDTRKESQDLPKGLKDPLKQKLAPLQSPKEAETPE